MRSRPPRSARRRADAQRTDSGTSGGTQQPGLTGVRPGLTTMVPSWVHTPCSFVPSAPVDGTRSPSNVRQRLAKGRSRERRSAGAMLCSAPSGRLSAAAGTRIWTARRGEPWGAAKAARGLHEPCLAWSRGREDCPRRSPRTRMGPSEPRIPSTHADLVQAAFGRVAGCGRETRRARRDDADSDWQVDRWWGPCELMKWVAAVTARHLQR